MPNRRLYTLIALLVLCMPLQAQINCWFREKPYKAVPRSQTSRHPQSAAVSSTPVPAVAAPVDTIRYHGIPDARLGRTATQLFSDFPGTRIVETGDERVTYLTPDSIVFELYDSRVVVARQTVKGNWLYPNEAWYKRIVDKALSSGITRHTHTGDVYTFYYPTFSFTLRYKKKTDTYLLRFEYLPAYMPNIHIDEY